MPRILPNPNPTYWGLLKQPDKQKPAKPRPTFALVTVPSSRGATRTEFVGSERHDHPSSLFDLLCPLDRCIRCKTTFFISPIPKHEDLCKRSRSDDTAPSSCSGSRSDWAAPSTN